MAAARSTFKANIDAALADQRLQGALAEVPLGFVAARGRARAGLPEFDALRRNARDLKDHTLANLDLYLETFEHKAQAAGASVHWASTGAEACEIILGICRDNGARLVLKSKSMVAEEIGLNARLEAAALEVVETDLGEYAIQIRGDAPSHIIAPAIHLTPVDIEADFRRRHATLAADRDLSRPEFLVAEARGVLREKFLAADVGITGANLLVAETGSAVIVTNEGNADLTLSLPRVHIVLASIEKVVPTLADACTLLRVLARSATGQELTAYTTFVTGARRASDSDGPAACHVVLLDNGRSALLGTPFREVLRCIRCGACMNHCPVYCSIGGHAYDAVYPGPIGAVLMPALAGPGAGELASASTFCGRCDAVCPVEIPLVDLMRRRRDGTFASASRTKRYLMRVWAAVALRPRAYHRLARVCIGALGRLAPRRGAFSWLPFAGPWTRYRDLPAPQGNTFHQLWARQRRQRERRRIMSRTVVLAQIRSALAGRTTAPARREAVAARLAAPPAPLLPQRARLPASERLAAFQAQLAAQGTDAVAVVQPALIPAAIAAYLGARCLPMRLRRGADPYLANLPWAAAQDLDVSEGPASGETEVGLSRAIAGVAETGTLVLAADANNPVTLAFLPETHIVVLAKAAVTGSYEEALRRVEESGEPGQLPRTVNFITGASRTGDIGGRIVMGAHGPRRLAVVIVEGD